MVQILHRGATTTQAIRRRIQTSSKSVRKLAREIGVSTGTVWRWRTRDFVEDLPRGRRNPRSTVLSPVEEAACVAFRRHTLLPLDDCLYTLQEVIPHLSRPPLHRCFQRHNISRLPKEERKKVRRGKFEECGIGFFHIDIAEVYTEEGRLQLFVAIDRVSRFVHAELHERKTAAIAAEFLRRLVVRVPFRIHTILTDNGLQFTGRGKGPKASAHVFGTVCREKGIGHRLTKANHPWTNGQVERMNRTIKEATVKKYHYGSHPELEKHPTTFLDAYNFARRLKALKGKTPFEEIMKWWVNKPETFTEKPDYVNMGLNTVFDPAIPPSPPAGFSALLRRFWWRGALRNVMRLRQIPVRQVRMRRESGPQTHGHAMLAVDARTLLFCRFTEIPGSGWSDLRCAFVDDKIQLGDLHGLDLPCHLGQSACRHPAGDHEVRHAGQCPVAGAGC